MVTTQKTAMSDSGRAILDAEELVALARLDMTRGALDQALVRLKQVFLMGEAPAEAATLLARLYAQLGLFKRAQEYYQRYLQANPRAQTEMFQLGMTHFDAGQTSEALGMWQDLLKEYPTHPPALFYSAFGLAQAGKPGDAKRFLDVLIKSAPVDNLYFSRAKELAQTIDAGRPPTHLSNELTGKGQSRGNTPDPYKVEH